jgi:two-component system, sensor histidine kinase
MHTLSSDLVRNALDSAPDPTVLVDAQGRVVFVNRQFSKVFGYERDEIRGQPMELLVPQRYRIRHTGYHVNFAAENRTRPMGAGLDLFATRKDGSEFPVEISLSPVQDQGARLVAAAIRDISEHKRQQQELIAARETAETARQIADTAREAADRANQSKSRFLATASHDLRQPLQSLSLLNGALRRLVEHPDALEVLEHQDKAIEAMSRLLNALLDISKLESGIVKPQFADFTTADLFKDLELEFAQLAASKGIQLVVPESAETVNSDRSLLGQILRNLLSNAIKYTRNGNVRLVTLRDRKGIRIEVIDTGVGIATDQQKLIFDEFYQVGVPTNSSRDGYGLGLSIVQRLVALLGIELHVHSELGKGSTFSLHLPLGQGARLAASASDRTAVVAPARQSSAPQVLLVEDDPAVRDATRLLLKVEGYRVLTASNLAEARSLAKTHPEVDLLVTDFHLSEGETGTQVITAVRSDLNKRLKAVLITGDTSSALRELQQDEALKLARKPIQADEFLSLLKSLLAV